MELISNPPSALRNEMAVAEGFEPSHGRINNPMPYQLGYATRKVGGTGEKGSGEKGKGILPSRSPLPLFLFRLEAMKGVEPLSSGLQDRRSVYPVELHRQKQFRVLSFKFQV